jgi:hypothetical protein
MSEPSSSDNGDDTSESSATAFIPDKPTPELLEFHRSLIMSAADEREKLVRVKKYMLLEDGGGTYLCMRLIWVWKFRPVREKEVGERWGVVRLEEISTCSKNDRL